MYSSVHHREYFRCYTDKLSADVPPSLASRTDMKLRDRPEVRRQTTANTLRLVIFTALSTKFGKDYLFLAYIQTESLAAYKSGNVMWNTLRNYSEMHVRMPEDRKGESEDFINNVRHSDVRYYHKMTTKLYNVKSQDSEMLHVFQRLVYCLFPMSWTGKKGKHYTWCLNSNG